MLHRIPWMIWPCIAVWAVGCSRTAETPQEAAENFVTAVRAQNRDLFFDNVLTGDDELTQACYEQLAARAAAESVFSGRFESLLPPAPADLQVLALGLDVRSEPTVMIRGNEAILVSAAMPLPIKKEEGRWCVDLTAALGETDRRELLLRLRANAQAYRKVAELARDGSRGLEDVERTSSTIWNAAAQEVAAMAGGTAAPASDAAAEAAVASRRLYTVRNGDTLIGIARQVYGADGAHLHQRIYEANRQKIRDPDMIPAGVKLVIPEI